MGMVANRSLKQGVSQGPRDLTFENTVTSSTLQKNQKGHVLVHEACEHFWVLGVVGGGVMWVNLGALHEIAIPIYRVSKMSCFLFKTIFYFWEARINWK